MSEPTETEFMEKVIALCESRGLLVFHSTDPRRDVGKGFPDLVIVGPYGHMFAELKTEHGKRSPDQMDWAVRLCSAGSFAIYHLWRPSHWSTIDQVTHYLATGHKHGMDMDL